MKATWNAECSNKGGMPQVPNPNRSGKGTSRTLLRYLSKWVPFQGILQEPSAWCTSIHDHKACCRNVMCYRCLKWLGGTLSVGCIARTAEVAGHVPLNLKQVHGPRGQYHGRYGRGRGEWGHQLVACGHMCNMLVFLCCFS